MSDSVYEPDEGPTNDGANDLDLEFGDDATDQMYDTSYSPPDREPVNTRFGTTWAEEERGESFEQRVAQEVPDPNSAADLGVDPDDEDAEDDTVDSEDLVYGEVGDQRAGRLVDPDQGAHEDEEKDLIGEDVGIDAGAASAEEAAIHIVPE
jgi:hypothetical protein